MQSGKKEASLHSRTMILMVKKVTTSAGLKGRVISYLILTQL